MRLGRMGRGEGGAESGVVVVGVMTPTERERGLEESLRRQLGECLSSCTAIFKYDRCKLTSRCSRG
jgi:hypothetical protein